MVGSAVGQRMGCLGAACRLGKERKTLPPGTELPPACRLAAALPKSRMPTKLVKLPSPATPVHCILRNALPYTSRSGKSAVLLG